MCQKRSSVIAQLTPDKAVRVDACLRNAMVTMYQHGIETVASCCGHGRYPITIVCRMKGRRDRYFELFSGKSILRVRNFYRMDSDGFYYIPETINTQKKLSLDGK